MIIVCRLSLKQTLTEYTGGNEKMNILLSILITVAFGLGLSWIVVGFYFYMLHGEGKVVMAVGALLVAIGITGIILV